MLKISNLKIRMKITLLLGIMICALIVVGGIGLSTVRETLLNDRKVEISEIINSSVAVAKGFQGRVDAGDISQPEAQSAFYNA